MELNTAQSIDRFIPRRNDMDIAHFNLEHTNTNSLSNFEYEDDKICNLQPTFFNTAKKAISMLSHRKNVLEALDVKHFNVLKGPRPRKKTYLSDTVGGVFPWPVKSRKKTLLRTPETVLDMPDSETIDTNLYRHVIDWGKQGQIATIFHREVHLWSCENGQIAQTQTEKTISNCIKWDRSGHRLAVSRSGSEISIIDGKTVKIIETVSCECHRCSITAIEWSKDNYVVTGCSKGLVTILSQSAFHIQRSYQLVREKIVELKLSCNNSYLLVTTIQMNTHVFKWPLSWTTSLAMTFESENTIWTKSTAWHPWKESLLVVGDMDNRVAVWNVNNQKLIDFEVVEPYFKKSTTCILDSLTFNPLSAELLVSFYHEDPDPSNNNAYNLLTVFSDLHTRVDEVRYHIGRVPHVLWDGTGTKLATVGTDENLAIWNFFGTESKTEKIHRRKKSRRIWDASLQFGNCIR